MKATRFNHVSIQAVDMEESLRFYIEVFGMERLPAPTFGGQAVVWLRLGDQQLHLMQRDGTAQFHHFGLDVDDFEAAYQKVRELEVRDDTTFVSLDRSVVGDLVRLVDMVPQNDEGMAAPLYIGTARQPLGERYGASMPTSPSDMFAGQSRTWRSERE
jgi:glyoxalase/bleomycin resistance protein/dioxygenase superfamily protein